MHAFSRPTTALPHPRAALLVAALLVAALTGCAGEAPPPAEPDAGPAPAPGVVCAPERPAPYASAAYVSNHGGPGNADRVRCDGPLAFAVQWQALEQRVVGQPNTFSPDGRATYVTSTRGPDGCALNALDTRTGAVLWSRCDLGDGLVASAVEVDADGVLYLTDGQTVLALDPADGSGRWRRDLPDAHGGLVYGAKLAADGDVVVQTADGVVHLLDRADGAVRGTLDVAAETGYVPGAAREIDPALVPPYVWDRFAVLFGHDDRDALEAAFGGLLGGSGAFADNTPAVAPGRIYSVGGGPTPERGAVVAIDHDAGELTLAWTTELAAGSASSVALTADGGRAYVADGAGTFVALDIAACDRNTDADPAAERCAPAWTFDQPGVVAGSMTVSDTGRIFAISIGEQREAALYAVDDAGDHPALAYATTYDPDEFFTTALTLADNALYGVLTRVEPLIWVEGVAVPITRAPVESRAVAIDPATGEVIFSAPVPDSSITELIPDPFGGLMLTMAGLVDGLVLDRDARPPVGGIVRLAPR